MSQLGGLLGLGLDLVEALAGAAPAASFAIATFGGRTITVSTALKGLESIPDIYRALKTGLSDLSADEAAATDIGNIVVAIDPALSLPIEIAELLLPWLVANVQAIGASAPTTWSPSSPVYRER